jgi:hypothetical protein
MGHPGPARTAGVGLVGSLFLSHDETEGHVYGFADADAGGDGDGGGAKAIVEDAQGGFGAGDVETVLREGDPQSLAETAGAGAE